MTKLSIEFDIQSEANSKSVKQNDQGYKLE